MTLHEFLFWLLALTTGGCAISVALTQNIVRAAVWLLFTLAGTSGLFFLLGADFIGATQLLIYVGGTLVLVVFGVMLTAQGPFVTMKAGAGEWTVSIVVGLILYGLIGSTVFLTNWDARPLDAEEPAVARSGNDLGGSLLGLEDFTPKAKLPVQPKDRRTPEPVQRSRMSYLLPFEIVSVHLLVVLLGAAYLARAKRRRSEPPA